MSLTNEIYHILAGALTCKFLSNPDLLKFKKVKQYQTATSSPTSPLSFNLSILSFLNKFLVCLNLHLY